MDENECPGEEWDEQDSVSSRVFIAPCVALQAMRPCAKDCEHTCRHSSGERGIKPTRKQAGNERHRFRQLHRL